MSKFQGREYQTESNWMSKGWMNRTMFVADGIHLATQGLTTANDFVQGAWNNDPNNYSKLGSNAGSLLEAGLGVGTWLAFGLHGHRASMSPKAFRANGKVFMEGANGVSHPWAAKGQWGTFGAAKGAEATSAIKAAAHEEGIIARKFFKPWQGKQFLKNPSGLKNFASIGAAVIAPMIIGAVGGAVMSYAGSYIDEVSQDMKARKAMYYDNRYFDTRQYDASSYQQIGMAMNDYSSKMQSIARVYHAR